VALALGSVLPRARPRHNASPRWAGVVVAIALAVAVGAVLTLPDWGVGRQPSRLVDRAQATVRDGPHDDGTLADAEALTWMACSSRPRYGRGWRVLGDIRLRRAVLRHDAELADAAADAFVRARRVNPLDAWAALGEGQARRVLGDDRGAWRALSAAVQLEPNFVSAWLERAVLHLAEGEMGAARNALGRAEAALKRAPRTTFVSTYEYALAWADPGILERLRSATGEAR
jgi:tetratricopeptide (TPR) repeat protein